MAEYWFCGIFPDNVLVENDLTDEQKQIIKEVKCNLNEESLEQGWLGYKVENGWKFMKHGMRVEYIEEERSNIARKILQENLKAKYEKVVQ